MNTVQKLFSDARINKQKHLDKLKADIGDSHFVMLLNKLKEMQAKDPITRGLFHVFMSQELDMSASIVEAIAEELDFPEFTDEELATINRVQAQKLPPEVKALISILKLLSGGLNGRN